MFHDVVCIIDIQSYVSKLAQSTPNVVVFTHAGNFRLTILDLRITKGIACAM
jgi:hypothetical protein